jgi:2-methylcitrate synthase
MTTASAQSGKPKNKTGGLAGVVAGKTAICTVGHEGKGLEYRGYSIHDLATQGSFEETAFLLLHGELPQRDELDAFRSRLSEQRALPRVVQETLKAIPGEAHPMDVLRTGTSMLGCIEPERSTDEQMAIAERLLACLPSMLVFWHRWANDGKAIDFDSDEPSLAGFFLEKLNGRTPNDTHRRAMDTSLVLYAEH